MIRILALAWLVLLPTPAAGQVDLDELLREVREGRAADREAARQREAEFVKRRNEQARLLREARAARDVEAQRAETLRARFEAREAELAELEAHLEERLGTLGELLTTARQTAGTARTEIDLSLISAQFPGRAEALAPLAEGRSFPGLEALETLWWSLQHEMTESGRSARFDAEVALPDGHRETRSVTRIGPFTATSEGRFLAFEEGRLAELPRQPGRAARRAAAAFEEEEAASLAPGVVDPSRGALLAVLVEAPTLGERLRQGGVIGAIIGVVGASGLALALWRAWVLLATGRAVRAQTAASPASDANPLGRILRCADTHPDASAEALELHLDEAITRETPALERGLSTLRVLTVVAPLLGLLGTVTGMIETFQMITLFGTGDPKIMAGGIAEALVTTMLGLLVAIPLTLLHGWLRDRSRGLIEVLEEQSAGLVAQRADGGRD